MKGGSRPTSDSRRISSSSVWFTTGPARAAIAPLLSVFGKKPLVIKAANATIGIRGTGAYLEVDPEKVYFCLCYGEADLDGPGMAAPKRLSTAHHENPLILTDRGGIMAATSGPVMNHTDDELILLESLVGRDPPFVNDPFRNSY